MNSKLNSEPISVVITSGRGYRQNQFKSNISEVSSIVGGPLVLKTLNQPVLESIIVKACKV